MKKAISAVLIAAIVLSIALICGFGGSAVTGQDVMDRIEEIIGKSYPGVFAQLEAVYSKVEVTDEMAGKLMPLVEDFAEIYAIGEASDGYTAEQGNKVIDLFDEASKIIGFSYVFHNVDNMSNPNLDPEIVTVEIFDDNGDKLGIVEGDGKAQGPRLGDVNNDGKIDAADATLVLQYYAEIIDKGTPGYYHEVSNVGGHENTTAVDATYILQYYAGIITVFPVEAV